MLAHYVSLFFFESSCGPKRFLKDEKSSGEKYITFPPPRLMMMTCNMLVQRSLETRGESGANLLSADWSACPLARNNKKYPRYIKIHKQVDALLDRGVDGKCGRC